MFIIKHVYTLAIRLNNVTACVTVHKRWQWRNSVIPIYSGCSRRHDVGQENVNTLRRASLISLSGAS